jgi:hypothetical protein
MPVRMSEKRLIRWIQPIHYVFAHQELCSSAVQPPPGKMPKISLRRPRLSRHATRKRLLEQLSQKFDQHYSHDLICLAEEATCLFEIRITGSKVPAYNDSVL